MVNPLACAERLSSFVYLDIETGHLGDIIGKIKNKQVQWPCRMGRNDWFRVMDGILKDEYLAGLRLAEIEEDKTGHRAAFFVNANGHGYVIFRGTGSDDEWEDNAQGMLETDTPAQQKAAQFAQRVFWQYKPFSITVAGHSKGGNKAQYSAITLPDGYVDSCFSFDGQGFSVAFCEKYKDEIKKRKPLLNLVSERRGFVHALGLIVAETHYYTGCRGEPRKNLPHGDPITLFHCPDALRDATGNIGPESLQNLIPAVINQLVVYFLTNPKYRPHWESTAKGLMTIMTIKKEPIKEPLAAIAHLTSAARHLIVTDSSFRKLVVEMAHKERNVLQASFDAARVAAHSMLEWEILANILKIHRQAVNRRLSPKVSY